MNHTSLIKKMTGIVGATTVATLASLPALAQVNPRPTVLNEPNYDGNPVTYQAPSATPSLTGVNPRPSIFSEPNYDGNPATRQASPATSSLSGVNPNPSILSEPQYTAVPGTAEAAPMTTPAAPMTTPAAPMPGMSTSSLDQEFMRMAANSDQFEIRTSQLALQKSSNPEVRQYAQRMIQEHTQSTQRLTQLAAQRNFTLPAAPSPFQQAVIEQLTPLSGTQFDRAYLEAQANGHLQTVAVFRSEIGQGKDQGVQSFASQLLHTIEGHYQMASRMTGQPSAMTMPMPSMNPIR